MICRILVVISPIGSTRRHRMNGGRFFLTTIRLDNPKHPKSGMLSPAVIDQFKARMLVMLVVSPLVLFLSKPGPAR